MADVRIGLVAPYKQLVSKSQKIAKRKKISLRAVYAALEDAVKTAKAMELDGIDVIVAREGTDVILKEHLNIPIVPIKICSFDIISAILKAGQIKKELVLANFNAMHKNIKTIEKVLGRTIREFNFSSRSENHSKIKKLDRRKQAVIGGGLSCSVAEEMGFRCILIESADAWVEYALDNAYRVAWSKFDEKQKLIQLSTIVNQIEESIVAVDTNKKIAALNATAENLFQISSDEAIGTYNDFILEKTRLIKVLDDNRECEFISNINGKDVIVHSVPVKVDKKNFGGVSSIHEADKVQKMEESIRYSVHSSGLTAKSYTFRDIIGVSDSIREAIQKARKFSKTDFTVLISGESGSGKEIFAHSIVNESARRKGPFIAINCAAIPSSLLEAELFGYEEGSFTGAKKGGKPGYFEIVHNGTIFLDEIGELTFDLQGRLLRVIEQKEVIKVGGSRVIPVDVRVIAATNRDLKEKVTEGKFREDLYHRLNVLHLFIPPLRNRAEDLFPLARHILDQLNVTDYNKKIITLALREITDYPWSGNIRELSNVLTQLTVLVGEDGPLSLDTVNAVLRNIIFDERAETIREKEPLEKNGTRKSTKYKNDKIEREILKGLLEEKGVRLSQVAKTMGISRSTLWRKMKRHGLSQGDND